MNRTYHAESLGSGAFIVRDDLGAPYHRADGSLAMSASFESAQREARSIGATR